VTVIVMELECRQGACDNTAATPTSGFGLLLNAKAAQRLIVILCGHP
jgi:hypothetical protein